MEPDWYADVRPISKEQENATLLDGGVLIYLQAAIVYNTSRALKHRPSITSLRNPTRARSSLYVARTSSAIEWKSMDQH